MAGGTGGHVFPGLAVAKKLKEQGVDVHWLGTSKGIEATLVPEAGIPLHLLAIGGLRGKGIKTLLKAPFVIASAIWQARKIIRATNPQVVLGMGGYASGPGGVASWLNRCPLVIHEQNAKAGYTNIILGKLAKRVLEGFPNAFAAMPKVMSVGNPVRNEIEQLLPPAQRMAGDRKRLRLLVVGGSLGAQALNQVVPEALSQLSASEYPEVWHQTGARTEAQTKSDYESRQLAAKVEPFIKDMAAAYAWADIVVCRAGALTVAELCAAGVGAIFVPFPHAVDDHQTANASYMVKAGAAECVQQQELTAERLAGMIRSLTPAKRLDMANAAYGLRKADVQKQIVATLQEVVKGERH